MIYNLYYCCQLTCIENLRVIFDYTKYFLDLKVCSFAFNNVYVLNTKKNNVCRYNEFWA